MDEFVLWLDKMLIWQSRPHLTIAGCEYPVYFLNSVYLPITTSSFKAVLFNFSEYVLAPLVSVCGLERIVIYGHCVESRNPDNLLILAAAIERRRHEVDFINFSVPISHSGQGSLLEQLRERYE